MLTEPHGTVEDDMARKLWTTTVEMTDFFFFATFPTVFVLHQTMPSKVSSVIYRTEPEVTRCSVIIIYVFMKHNILSTKDELTMSV